MIQFFIVSHLTWHRSLFFYVIVCLERREENSDLEMIDLIEHEAKSQSSI
jgi:hypothetical protein